MGLRRKCVTLLGIHRTEWREIVRRLKWVPAILGLVIVPVLIYATCPLSAPKLTNNPSLDVIVTTGQPLLSFFNATGGTAPRTYIIQIDKVPTFSSKALIEYRDVPEESKRVTSFSVKKKDALDDKSRYYWRVRAVDSSGKQGPWSTSRFFVDTGSDDSFMNLVRIPVKSVTTSSGSNAKNIVDLDDPGQVTFWQATPPGDPTQWVIFDLGKRWKVSRIWMLSNPSWAEKEVGDGWLKDFVWQASDNLTAWRDISGTRVTGNDTFRNILRFDPVETRYLRLLIRKWDGYAPQINAITLYSPGRPPVPEVPDRDYVLIVGNQQNGFTFTELAEFVEGLGLDLATLTVPHYEVSLDMLKNLKRKPVAIILSGSDAYFANLPMFEYNGEYEIVRHSDIPILGICCGHQMTVLAYGYTNVRAMGWSDISSMRLKDLVKTRIVKQDPIFSGMPNPFTAPEVHSWAVARLPQHFEVIAESGYVQCLKSSAKLLYGEQFHAEIKAPYNQAKPYLVNFLKMALERARE